MNKPKWKDAPEWANYLAIGKGTEKWTWFEHKPTMKYGGYDGQGRQISADEWDEIKRSLEERPND